MKPGLTAKQQLFVNAYRTSRNGTKAAKEAGYTHPAQQGSRMLNNVKVIAALALIAEEGEARAIVKADDVLAELGKLAMVNMLDYSRVDEKHDLVADFTRLTRDQAACITSIENRVMGDAGTEVKLKLADKHAALVSLGRHYGLFLDRHEVEQRGFVSREPRLSENEFVDKHNAERPDDE